MNAPAIKISKPVREQNEVVQYTNHLMLPGTRRRFGLLEWPALLRKLDRADPSYRD